MGRSLGRSVLRCWLRSCPRSPVSPTCAQPHNAQSSSSLWRPIALQRLGVAETLDGRFTEARDALTEAVQLSGGENTTAAFSLAYLALTSLHEGDEEAACHFAHRAHGIVDGPGLRTFMPSIATYSVVAHLLSRRGDVTKATQAVDRANALLPKVSEVSWWQMILSRVLLAPALVTLGRRDEAVARLEEAAALATDMPFALCWLDRITRRDITEEYTSAP